MSGTIAGDFARMYDRDLAALATQLERYAEEAGIWRLGGSIKNSAGTLALHLVGNMEHFVGAVLGGTGYVRDREAEFGDRDVPRAEILDRIAHCREVVGAALAALDDEAVFAPYPGRLPPIYDEGTPTHLFLLHLAAHLGWHLGQVDYHRRLLG